MVEDPTWGKNREGGVAGVGDAHNGKYPEL